MVYNENLDVRVVETVDLIEPRLSRKIKVRSVCYPIVILFLLDDIFHLILTFDNFYEREKDFLVNVELPVNFALRSVTILATLLLLIGLLRQKSTPIAIFLWTIFEINILFVTFYCYKSIKGMMGTNEMIKENLILILKAGLWWTVNAYHNFIKEKEFILRGAVRRSTAFTNIKKYRLIDPKV